MPIIVQVSRTLSSASNSALLYPYLGYIAPICISAMVTNMFSNAWKLILELLPCSLESLVESVQECRFIHWTKIYLEKDGRERNND